MRPLTYPATGLLFFLCGCTSLPDTTDPSQRNGQSWVVTRATTAHQLVQRCPNRLVDRLDDLYAPSRVQIDSLEQALADLQTRIATAIRDDRQYVGIIQQGKSFIWAYGTTARDNRTTDLRRVPLGSCDEGWEALYDPSTGQFIAARHLSLQQGN